MSKSDDADAAAFAALCLVESIYRGMIRSGMFPRDEALNALDFLAAKIESRSAAHAAAADELRRFRSELVETPVAN